PRWGGARRRAWGRTAAMWSGGIRGTTVRAGGNRFSVTLILTVAGGGSPRGGPNASEPGLPGPPPIFRKPAPIGDDRVSGRRVERTSLDRMHQLAARTHGLGSHPLPGVADQVHGTIARAPERK